MDRGRPDIPPEDRYGTGAGQSYRPGVARERTSPPPLRFRSRSPSRRNDRYDSYQGTANRPRSRSPPPPRRDDYRRRSPSPARIRDRDVRPVADTYRTRPRSPAPATRREDLPRDDLFRREPARDPRDYRDERGIRDERDYPSERDRAYGTAGPAPTAHSPRYRDRSPVPLKRVREPSPVGSRGRRSPPPAKRERVQSPRGRYEDGYASRQQSPPRRRYSPDPRDSRAAPADASRDARAREPDEYRKPPSPSPARYSRQDYHGAEENGRDSAATSRRSSPPLHPTRLQHVDDRAVRAAPRDPYDSREPYREESRRAASPPPRERVYADDRIPPPREPYRADDAPVQRAPPTGPAGYRAPTSSMAPPTGPSATTSAYPRPSAAAPPSGPRAGGAPRGDFGTPRGRGGFRGGRGGFEGGRGGFDSGRGGFDGGRGGFEGNRGNYDSQVSSRGGRGGFESSLSYRGGRGGAPPPGPSYGRSESFDRDMDYSNGAPTGPSSAGPPSGPRSSFSSSTALPSQPFRQSSNSTTTTYPRTQRFAPNGQPLPDDSPHRTSTPTTAVNGPPTGPRAARIHPAIADLPKAVEGGVKAETLVDRTKLEKLQAEAEVLRKAIEEKEAKRRKGMREWERLGRETEAAAFRSQVAEEGVRNASGEGEGEGAF